MQEMKFILERIEILRRNLNESISLGQNCTDKEILIVSTELDILILKYYASMEDVSLKERK